MPSISAILDSISVPSLIKDDVIQRGKFENAARGVIYYTGGFTVVFPVDINGHKWAFRCWHTEMGNVRERFKKVSDYINSLNSPYFGNFYYCDEGLIVDGKIFPTTRMDWIKGETINQYIYRNANNKDKLLALADEFLSMIDFLHTNNIAHGDLQHGNIIVTDSGKIKLVDYDSLFVPGLENANDIITGKAEFQHPKRRNNLKSSAKLDYFSELVIYLSIIAIAHDPSLIDKFSIEDSLLFQSNDWNSFEDSEIYLSLKTISNDDVTILLEILNSYLREENIENLLPFPLLWENLLNEPIIHNFTCGLSDGIVYKGKETTITWEAENVGHILLAGIELPKEKSSYKMTFTKDCDLVLVVRNGLHTVEKVKHIRVVDIPSIYFSVSKNKLKKNDNSTESTKLFWDVSNSSSVTLRCGNKILSTENQSTGFTIKPACDSKYELIVIGLDNKSEFKSEISIIVKNPANIQFESDKQFTLPEVPVILSWTIDHAKSVKLNDKTVPHKGSATFTPTGDTDFRLAVTDEFGETIKNLKIRMLPLPVVERVIVHTPNLNEISNIQYSAPKFEATPNIPAINSEFIKLQAPMSPDLKQVGLFVEMQDAPTLSLAKRISNFIKNIIR